MGFKNNNLFIFFKNIHLVLLLFFILCLSSAFAEFRHRENINGFRVRERFVEEDFSTNAPWDDIVVVNGNWENSCDVWGGNGNNDLNSLTLDASSGDALIVFNNLGVQQGSVFVGFYVRSHCLNQPASDFQVEIRLGNVTVHTSQVIPNDGTVEYVGAWFNLNQNPYDVPISIVHTSSSGGSIVIDHINGMCFHIISRVIRTRTWAYFSNRVTDFSTGTGSGGGSFSESTNPPANCPQDEYPQLSDDGFDSYYGFADNTTERSYVVDTDWTGMDYFEFPLRIFVEETSCNPCCGPGNVHPIYLAIRATNTSEWENYVSFDSNLFDDGEWHKIKLSIPHKYQTNTVQYKFYQPYDTISYGTNTWAVGQGVLEDFKPSMHAMETCLVFYGTRGTAYLQDYDPSKSISGDFTLTFMMQLRPHHSRDVPGEFTLLKHHTMTVSIVKNTDNRWENIKWTTAQGSIQFDNVGWFQNQPIGSHWSQIVLIGASNGDLTICLFDDDTTYKRCETSNAAWAASNFDPAKPIEVGIGSGWFSDQDHDPLGRFYFAIDEIRLWNIQIDNSKMKSYFKPLDETWSADFDNLVGYWDLNEGSCGQIGETGYIEGSDVAWALAEGPHNFLKHFYYPLDQLSESIVPFHVTFHDFNWNLDNYIETDPVFVDLVISGTTVWDQDPNDPFKKGLTEYENDDSIPLSDVHKLVIVYDSAPTVPKVEIMQLRAKASATPGCTNAGGGEEDYCSSDGESFMAFEVVNTLGTLIDDSVTVLDQSPQAYGNVIYIYDNSAHSFDLFVTSRTGVDGSNSGTIVTLPSSGTLTGINGGNSITGSLTYQIAGSYADYPENDYLEWTYTDNTLTTPQQTVNFIKRAPVALDDPSETANSQIVTVLNVLSNDFYLQDDLDNGLFTITSITSPTGATASINDLSTAIEFTADGSETSVSFDYTVTLDVDGTPYTSTATVTVAVSISGSATADDIAPPAFDEDTSTNITLSGSTSTSFDMIASISTFPSHGSLYLAGQDNVQIVNSADSFLISNNVVYVPDENYYGNDFFLYTISDRFSDSPPANVSLTISPVNDPPTFEDIRLRMDPLTNPLTISPGDLGATDVDGDPLTYNVISTVITTNGYPGTATVKDDTGDDLTNPKSDIVFDVVVEASVGGIFATPFVTMQMQVTDGIENVTAFVYIDSYYDGNEPVALDDTFSGLNEDTGYRFQLNFYDPNFDSNYDYVFETRTIPPATDGQLEVVVCNGGSSGVPLGTNENIGNNCGQIWFQPADNFFGSTSFTFVVIDADGTSDPAGTITLEYDNVNDAPEAHDVYVETIEDNSIDFALSYDDVDGDDVSFELIGYDSIIGNITFRNGTLVTSSSQSTALYTFVPEPNFNSQIQTFQFVVSDGIEQSFPAGVVTINVTAANDDPVAIDINESILEDSAQLIITLLSTDVDFPDDTHTFFLNTDPSLGQIYNTINGEKADIRTADGNSIEHGTIGASSNVIIYVPNKDAEGTESFEYYVRDEVLAQSNTATVEITIVGQNDPPTATDFTIIVDEGDPFTFRLNCSDVDNGDTLTYYIDTLLIPSAGIPSNILTSPAGDIITSTGNTTEFITYQSPNRGLVIDYSASPLQIFSYHCTDSDGISTGLNTVNIDVTNQNDPPSAQDITIYISKDDTTNFVLSDFSQDNDFGGIVNRFEFNSTSTLCNCIDVGGADSLADTEYAIGDVISFDPDGTAGTYTYYFFVKDSGNLDSPTYQLVFIASELNQPPVPDNINPPSFDEETSTLVTLTATDPDSSPASLKFRIETYPSDGRLVIDGSIVAISSLPFAFNGTDVQYVPNKDFFGVDTFQFSAADEENIYSTQRGNVTLTVDNLNDPPETTSIYEFNGFEQIPVTINLNDGTSDVDGDVSFTFTISNVPDSSTVGTLTDPNNGDAIVNDGNTITSNLIQFVSVDNFEGTVKFNYVATDPGSLPSNPPGEVVIIIWPVNDAPVVDGSIVVNVDQNSDYTNNIISLEVIDDSDGGGPYRFWIDSDVSHGVLGVQADNNGTFSVDDVSNELLPLIIPDDFSLNQILYKPDYNYVGTDNFTYFARDSSGLKSLSATVNIIVNDVDFDPVVLDMRRYILEDAVGTIISLDGTDPDDDIVSYDVNDSLLTGTLTPFDTDNITGNEYQYTPTQHFTGEDVFTFSATDSVGRVSNDGTYTIIVQPIGDKPICHDGYLLTQETKQASITLQASDSPDSPSVDPSNFVWRIVTLPVYGQLLQADGTPINSTTTNILSTPGELQYFASDLGTSGSNITLFEYVVYDHQHLVVSETCTVIIDIEGANNQPRPVLVEPITGEDISIEITLGFTDSDPDLHRIRINTTVAEGGVLRRNSINGSIINDNEYINSNFASISFEKVVFIPEENFNCNLECPFFQWIVEDNSGFPNANSETASTTIRVQSINDAPVISSQYLSIHTETDEDVPLLIDFSSYVSDVDSPEINFRVIKSPLQGTLYVSDSAGNFDLEDVVFGLLTEPYIVYVPNPEVFDITDSFQWVAEDNRQDRSDAGTFSIFINELNDAPLPVNSRISTRESASVLIQLSATDLEGDDWSAIISQFPTRGVIYQFRGEFDESGRPLFFAEDAFSIRANVVDDELKRLVYVPLPREFGKNFDYFLWYPRDVANRPLNDHNIGRVDIDVNENVAPEGTSRTVETLEDEDVVIELTGTDSDNDPVIARISFLPIFGRLFQVEIENGAPTRGTEILSDVEVNDKELNRIIYAPPRDKSGVDFTDEFGFLVFDGDDWSNQDAKIIVNIIPVQDYPEASSVSISEPEDQLFAIILNGKSPDGSTVSKRLKAVITQLPTRGTLYQNIDNKRNEFTDRGDPILGTGIPDGEISDEKNKLFYQSNLNTYGEDSFKYFVYDTVGELPLQSNEATITLNIQATNDPPVVEDFYVGVIVEGDTVEMDLSLHASDVDDELASLSYTITSEELDYTEMFQVLTPETGTSKELVEILIVPSDLSEEFFAIKALAPPEDGPNAFLSAEGKKRANFTITYISRDGSGGTSDPAQISFTIEKADSDDESSIIPVIIGIVAGVLIFGCIILMLMWFLAYKKKQDQDSISIVDQLNRVKTSNEHLEKLLIEPPFTVAAALSDVIEITTADDLATSLVSIFVNQSNPDLIIQILEVFIRKEVQQSKNPSTLFRGNSIASKMMKAYSKLIGKEYLQETLPELVQEVINSPGAYEVDPRKLSGDANLEENWGKLMPTTERFFNAIASSIIACPIEFRRLCNFLHGEISQHFPDFGNVHTFIGGFLFLRFFCPAIVAPEAYQIVEETPDLHRRRGLILVSKGIQNLSNNVQFGSKEEYMMPMNQFIVSNLRRVKDFLTEIANLPKNIEEFPAAEIDLEGCDKSLALSTIHRFLFFNDQAVLEKLRSEGHTGENATEYLEHIAALDLILTYSEVHTDEITEVLVQDVPLVLALASTLDHTDKSSEISKGLITIFEAHTLTVQLLREVIQTEIKQVRSANMLLRENSTSLRLIKGLVLMIGVPYLQTTLSTFVSLVISDPQGYELDENRLQSGETIPQNIERLTNTLDEFLGSIFSRVNDIPIQLRVLSKSLCDTLDQSNFKAIRTTALADLLFSRIICPAIVNPVKYSLVDNPSKITPLSKRALINIAKTIKNVALFKTFKASDPLSPINDYIKTKEESTSDFLDNVIDVDESAADKAQNFLITNELLNDSVLAVHSHIKQNEQPIRSVLTIDKRTTGDIASRLDAILESLGPPVDANIMSNQNSQPKKKNKKKK